MDKQKEIIASCLEFAIDIIVFIELLEESRKFVIARQLLMSGNSIGANIREAQSAASKEDFMHKLKISSKKAEEAACWLLLCKRSKNYPNPGKLNTKLNSLQKHLGKIIST